MVNLAINSASIDATTTDSTLEIGLEVDVRNQTSGLNSMNTPVKLAGQTVGDISVGFGPNARRVIHKDVVIQLSAIPSIVDSGSADVTINPNGDEVVVGTIQFDSSGNPSGGDDSSGDNNNNNNNNNGGDNNSGSGFEQFLNNNGKLVAGGVLGVGVLATLANKGSRRKGGR